MSTRWTETELAEYVNRNPRALRSNPLSPAPVKPNKYRNKPTEVDNIRFASKREATRYQDLKVMQELGIISNLKLQVPFVFNHNGVKICKYVADFSYQENGCLVVEDAKSTPTKTRLYLVKKNMMKAFYGISVREV